MINKIPLFILPLFLFLQIPTILSQGPAQSPTTSPPADSTAAAPTAPAPTNVTKILEKGGQFGILIRLLKSTKEDDQINSLLNDTNQELTIFAPNDNAFSSLKSGTLNSLSDQDKVNLIQFHLLPTYLTLSNFQTLSNPVRTQAGDLYEFPLNVTTSGNSVNITSGLTNTSVSGTVYTDGQLAVYQVDQVLKPIGIFSPRPPPPAPAPEKQKKKAADLEDGTKAKAKEDDSGAISLTRNVMISNVGVIALIGVLLL